jgi:serine/threonine protein kinase
MASRANESSGRVERERHSGQLKMWPVSRTTSWATAWEREPLAACTETVAIKQVRLENLGAADLKNMEMEIDLLKNLNHPNIVKYNGFVRSSESLYIILE